MAGEGAPEAVVAFDGMGLDPMLLKAIQKRGYAKPTPVQAECVPAALEGKDIVGLAKTGSGKTVAYLLPALNKILARKSEGKAAPWQALILVPTRELCQQVGDEATQFAKCSGGAFGVTILAHQGQGPAVRAALASASEIVVATPARISQSLREGLILPKHLQGMETLVLDEADLLLSYGYEEDVQTLAPQIPRSCQCMLMSATTSKDVEKLTALVLHNPIKLNLMYRGATGGDGDAGGDEGEDKGGGVSSTVDHHTVACKNEDRLLHLLTLLRLSLVPRKALIFVNSIDSGFKVKLFLEGFGVRAAILNAELPLNSRQHILQEFNRGLFDYLVATDDGKVLPHEGGAVEGEGKGGKSGKKGKKGAARSKKVVDGEFGVVRGVDFKGVRTVINFDLPGSLSSYVHRVGRTGRAGNRGVAVTLAPPQMPDAAALMAEVRGHLGGRTSGAGGSAGGGDGDGEADPVTPFPTLTQASVEGLRYRAEDVARSVTKLAIREARAKELRLEILNSERLKAHFEDNPGDLALLKHDKPLAQAPAPAHLKQVPGYLRDPKALPAHRSSVGGGVGHAVRDDRPRKRKAGGGGVERNPLKSFKTSAFTKPGRKNGRVTEEPSAFENTVMDGLWTKTSKKERRDQVGAKETSKGGQRRNVRSGGRKRSR